jgi:hypothetical protein
MSSRTGTGFRPIPVWSIRHPDWPEKKQSEPKEKQLVASRTEMVPLECSPPDKSPKDRHGAARWGGESLFSSSILFPGWWEA